MHVDGAGQRDGAAFLHVDVLRAPDGRRRRCDNNTRLTQTKQAAQHKQEVSKLNNEAPTISLCVD